MNLTNPKINNKVKDEDIFNKFLDSIKLNNINIQKFLNSEKELISFLHNCNFTDEQINKINKILCDINVMLAKKEHTNQEIYDVVKNYYNKYYKPINIENSDYSDEKLYFVLFILLVIVFASCHKKKI